MIITVSSAGVSTALSVREVARLVRSKEASIREVTVHLLDRIRRMDASIRAFLTVDEEGAMKRAEELERLSSRAGAAGDALFGVPYASKDNICTKGLRTTCGSRILENFVPPYDATVTVRLRDAGAVLLGKTNMDEFAMGSSCENSGFFPTRNPWDLTRVPGGSSGGSAAAVSAGLVPFALGSDTGGSVRQPAALCGVVGLKPTYGRVSRYGLVAFASSLDQIGPLTRNVADCATVMNVIGGHDAMDSTSVPMESENYLDCLERGVKGMKIGVPVEYMGTGISPGVREAVLRALEVLEGEGAIVEECSLPHTEYALSAYYLIAPAEASSNLARYDGVRYGIREESDDLITMYGLTRSRGFGPEVKRRIMLGTYALSAGYYDAYYLKALKVRTLVRRDFDEAFKKYDALVSPTSPTTAFEIGEKTDDPLTMYMSDVCTIPTNLAGIPAISIPCGFDGGLPVGLQIMGKPFEEGTILRIASAYEQASGYHDLVPAGLREGGME